MKRIPNEYWKQNYKEIPTKFQQAWIQRCLELLDSNSSYIFSLKSSNLSIAILDLIDEYKKDPDIKKPRNFSRIIYQIEYYSLEYDISYFFKNDILNNYNNIHIQTEELFDKKTGYIKKNIENRDDKIRNYKENLKNFIKKINNEEIINLTTFYRNSIIKECKNILIENKNNHFHKLNILTQAIFTDCIIKDSYSFLYLTELFVKTFLRKKEETFKERVESIFQSLQVNNLKNRFTIYFRIQAKHILKEIKNISNIKFYEFIKIDNNIINKNIKQKKDIEKFFYLNRKDNINLIFLEAQNIEAKDHYQAIINAFEEITKIFQQIKFEYELNKFNIDNKIYVLNHRNEELVKANIKQINSYRYGRVGDIERLKKILKQTDFILSKDEISFKKRLFIQKLINITLDWHRTALDINSSKSKFLHHWIGLEHLFNSIEELTIKIDNNGREIVKSSADKLTICLNQTIQEQMETKLLQDLWGDIIRLKILGTKRILATEDGIYNNRKINSKFIKPLIKTNLIIKDGEMVKKGEWITNSGCNSLKERDKNILLELFKDTTPKLENLLFLSLNSSKIKPHHLYYKNPPETIYTLKLYEEIENNIGNLLINSTKLANLYSNKLKEFIKENLYILNKYYNIYLELKKYWNKIEKKLHKLNPNILCELFHSQTPPIENIKQVIKNDKTKLIELCKSQPLFIYRIEEIYNHLTSRNKIFPNNFFTIELDKMRRIRNQIVHEAIYNNSLEIINQRLYKYIRVYLKESIYKNSCLFKNCNELIISL